MPQRLTGVVATRVDLVGRGSVRKTTADRGVDMSQPMRFLLYKSEGGAGLPDEDYAGPDKSFPIGSPQAVHDAAQSLGRAGSDDMDDKAKASLRARIKARIVSIARRKGAAYVAQLPDAWKTAKAEQVTNAILAFEEMGVAKHDMQFAMLPPDIQGAIYELAEFAGYVPDEDGDEKPPTSSTNAGSTGNGTSNGGKPVAKNEGDTTVGNENQDTTAQTQAGTGAATGTDAGGGAGAATATVNKAELPPEIRTMIEKAEKDAADAKAEAALAKSAAEAERSARLDREFLAKAEKLSHLPVTGVAVLKAEGGAELSQAQSIAQVMRVVSEKAPDVFPAFEALLEGAEGVLAESELLAEKGSSMHGGMTGGALEQLQKKAQEIAKSDTTLTSAQAFSRAIDLHQDLYAQYLSESGQAR